MKKTKQTSVKKFTFDDLKIVQHPVFSGGIHGKKFFENGYGISVVNGHGAYVSGNDQYEIAVLFGNEEKYELTYNTQITDDVIGYLSKEEVEEYMNKISKL